MHLRTKLRSMVALVLALGSPGLMADAGQFYIAPGMQWLDFDRFANLEDESGFFLGLGYDITDRISAELSAFNLETKSDAGEKVDVDHYKLDFIYALDLSIGAIDTFLTSGFGSTDFEGDNEQLWDLGVGFKYELSSNLTLRTTVRSFNYFDRDVNGNDIGVEAALEYRFGGRRPAAVPELRPAEVAPTPAVADSDRDGVPDDRDSCPDTPRNYAVNADGCPIPVEEVARVELSVNFDFDRSEVKPQYFSEIEVVADFMEQYPDVVVELEGYTDSVGTEEYNRGLSDRRASAVRQLLIDRFDIQASRVSIEGFGESQPVATNDTSAGRAQNRRVITVIIKTLQNYRPR